MNSTVASRLKQLEGDIESLKDNNRVKTKTEKVAPEAWRIEFRHPYANVNFGPVYTHQELYDMLMKEIGATNKRLDTLLKHLKLEEFTESEIPAADKLRSIKEGK